MKGAIWTGFLTGLWLSMSFGPVFFMLLSTSIKKGAKEALLFDAGVFISDMLYIVIAILGATIILDNEIYKDLIAIIGGIILIIFGLLPFFNSKKEQISTESIEPEIVNSIDNVMNNINKPLEATGIKANGGLKNLGLITKGFVMNFLNPSVLIIWFTAAAGAFATFDKKQSLVISYFIVTLITYFGIDILKIYLAVKLKKFLNTNSLTFIHKLSGVVIIVFGTYLIIEAVKW
jgi:threonine/homoserine/homoserine lactone efflux protein